MFQGSRFEFLRSRPVLIAAAAVFVVAVIGIGVYLSLQPKPKAEEPSATPEPTAAAPSMPVVGAQTVSDANTVEVLTMVATSPGSGSSGATDNSPIDLRFNLPVDPATVASYFSVLPAVPGTFSQGLTPQEILFTPSTSFGFGSSVNVVMRRGFASRDGYLLQDDYSFSFITTVSAHNALFLVHDQLARLYNAQSGRSVTVTLQFGEGVPAQITLETLRATSADLLAAQVHDASGAYLENPIDTAAMQSVGKQQIANGGVATVTQPDGIYLLLAADAQHQYGAMWLDFSRFGVILRQDDQKIVLAGEDLTTGSTTPPFDVTFFNLAGSVQPVLTGSFTSTGEFAVAFASRIDIAVATTGGEELVIPLGIPETNADLKVVADLSKQPQIFLTTDRAAYQKGETVNFAGLVRISNDQAYTVPTGLTVAVWSGYGTPKLVNETAVVAADGTFSGSFVVPTDALSPDGTDGQLVLRAGTMDQLAADFSPSFAVIGVLGERAPAAMITVTFDRSTYLASDSIVASVSGVDSSGKPLAGKSVRLTVYSAGRTSQPNELGSYPALTTWGLPAQDAVAVPLDAKGKATYTFKANVADKAADQEVTLAAGYGAGATAAVGARTAIVYQAADELFMLPSRTVYQVADAVIAPFVVETRAGERAANVAVTYELDRTEYDGSNATTTVVASGTLTTDANGRGTVRTTSTGPAGWLILRIRGQDAAGNVFADSRSITIAADPASLSLFGPTDALMQLSVTTDKIAYAVGDEAHLVVTAPAAQNVLLSLERGRIHLSRWIALAQGDNPLTLTITPDLAPGFTTTFSYFNNGTYLSEGLPISVDSTDRLLKLTMTPDQTSYAAGQTAHVTITVTDSAGTPVAASLLVDGYDASMSAYKLVDQESIAGAFFAPSVRGTNGSSSLIGIGTWGGRCGGDDGGPQPAVTNPGHSVVWLTSVTTDATGTTTIVVPVRQASVRLVLFAATSTTSVGQGQIDLDVP